MSMDVILEMAKALWLGQPVTKPTDSQFSELLERFGKDGRLPFQEGAELGAIESHCIINEEFAGSTMHRDDLSEQIMRMRNLSEEEGAAQAKAILESIAKKPSLEACNYKVGKMPNGVLAQIKYNRAQMADRLNRNNRVYAWDDMVEACQKGDARAKSGNMMTLGGHPAMCETPTMRKVSGAVRSMTMDQKTGYVTIETDVIGTEQGQAILAMLKAEMAVPISSRAYGVPEFVDSYQGKFGEIKIKPRKGDDDDEDSPQVIVMRNLDFVGFDQVAGDQGVPGAIVLPRTRGAVKHQEGVKPALFPVKTIEKNNPGSPDGDLNQEDDTMSEALKNEQARTARLQEEVESLHTKCTKLREAKTEVECQVSTLKVSAASFEAEKKQLTSRLEALEAQLATAKTEHATAKTALEAQVTELKNKYEPVLTKEQRDLKEATDKTKRELAEMKAEKEAFELEKKKAKFTVALNEAIAASPYAAYATEMKALAGDVPLTEEGVKKTVESLETWIAAVVDTYKETARKAAPPVPPVKGHRPPIETTEGKHPERGAGNQNSISAAMSTPIN